MLFEFLYYYEIKILTIVKWMRTYDTLVVSVFKVNLESSRHELDDFQSFQPFPYILL